MMAVKKTETKMCRVRVVSNPEFCGVDAGGVQFAHGEAVIPCGTMADWFREHEGYEVTDVAE